MKIWVELWVNTSESNIEIGRFFINQDFRGQEGLRNAGWLALNPLSCRHLKDLNLFHASVTLHFIQRYCFYAV